MKKKLFLFLAFIIVYTKIQADQYHDLEFLPPLIFKTSYATVYQEYNSMLHNNQERSLLSSAIEDNNFDKNDFNGKITETLKKQELKIQIGLTPSLTLGVLCPYITRQRYSDLTLENENLTASNQESFFNQYKSAKTEGIGDYEIWLLNRFLYTDNLDFQGFLGFQAASGEFYYNQNDHLSLGAGNHFLTGMLRWLIYSDHSNLKTTIELLHSRPISDTNIEVNNEKYRFVRGTINSFRYTAEWYYQKINYGGGFYWKGAEADTIQGLPKDLSDLNDTSQNISITAHAFIGYGNLFLLQQNTTQLNQQLWQVYLRLSTTTLGNNTHKINTLRFETSLYF